MKLVIPICEATLDLIQVLNSGVRPVVEKVDTYYIFEGCCEHAEIIIQMELEKMPTAEWTMIPLAFTPE